MLLHQTVTRFTSTTYRASCSIRNFPRDDNREIGSGGRRVVACDQREMGEFKPNLPQSRVSTVRRALLAAGVESWRFVPPPAQWGDNWRVLCQEDSAACREKNRRVEIFVTQWN